MSHKRSVLNHELSKHNPNNMGNTRIYTHTHWKYLNLACYRDLMNGLSITMLAPRGTTPQGLWWRDVLMTNSPAMTAAVWACQWGVMVERTVKMSMTEIININEIENTFQTKIETKWTWYDSQLTFKNLITNFSNKIIFFDRESLCGHRRLLESSFKSRVKIHF